MDDADDVVARATDLERRIEERQGVIADLLNYAAANRRVSRIALALAIVLAVVVVAVVLTVIRVRDNADHLARIDDVAAAVAENLRTSCDADNDAKRGESELWKSIFDIPPGHELTEAEQQQRAQILAVVVRVFAITDCTVPTP